MDYRIFIHCCLCNDQNFVQIVGTAAIYDSMLVVISFFQPEPVIAVMFNETNY